MRANQGATLVRLLTALVMLPVVLALIWIPRLDLAFVGLIAVLSVLGLREFYAMVVAKGIDVSPKIPMFFGLLMTLVAWWSPFYMNTALVLGVVVVAWAQVLRSQVSLTALSVSLWGLVYVGWFPAHFVLLHTRGQGFGPSLVTLLVVIIALSDSGAYFVGKSIGKNKLSPTISPNKTWEGSIGGVAAALLGVAGAWYLDHHVASVHLPGWALWQYALVGVVLAVTGQVGDLVESMIKRDADVKDSGDLFPGHGGVLDRCDGYLFAGPVLYYLLAWLPATA